MKSHPRPRLYRWLVVASQIVAVGVSAKLSWDFGSRVAGAVLGGVLALNAAVFSSIVVDVIFDRLLRPKASDQDKE